MSSVSRVLVQAYQDGGFDRFQTAIFCTFPLAQHPIQFKRNYPFASAEIRKIHAKHYTGEVTIEESEEFFENVARHLAQIVADKYELSLRVRDEEITNRTTLLELAESLL